MPRAHRRHAEWTIERIHEEAAAIGAATAALTTTILRSRPHPEQGFRACLGILRLVRSYGRDRQPSAAGARTDELPLIHSNICGSGYYH
jgi:transposase